MPVWAHLSIKGLVCHVTSIDHRTRHHSSDLNPRATEAQDIAIHDGDTIPSLLWALSTLARLRIVWNHVVWP